MRRDVDTLRWVTVVEARGLLQAVGSPAGAPYSSRHRIARGGLWRGPPLRAPGRGPGNGARGGGGWSPPPPRPGAEVPAQAPPPAPGGGARGARRGGPLRRGGGGGGTWPR